MICHPGNTALSKTTFPNPSPLYHQRVKFLLASQVRSIPRGHTDTKGVTRVQNGKSSKEGPKRTHKLRQDLQFFALSVLK